MNQLYFTKKPFYYLTNVSICKLEIGSRIIVNTHPEYDTIQFVGYYKNIEEELLCQYPHELKPKYGFRVTKLKSL